MKRVKDRILALFLVIVLLTMFVSPIFAGGFTLPVGVGQGAISVYRTSASATSYEGNHGYPCRATITGYRGTVFVKSATSNGAGWARAEIQNVQITYGRAQWMVNGVSRSDIAYP